MVDKILVWAFLNGYIHDHFFTERDSFGVKQCVSCGKLKENESYNCWR